MRVQGGVWLAAFCHSTAMPEYGAQAKSNGPVRITRQHRFQFATLAVSFYVVLCLPILALHRFDPGVFVVAGSRWVNAGQVAASIPVRANSGGYDGQFYYRLAQNPFVFETTVGGITFDHPAKRAERLLYPLAAWLLSLGMPKLTASALFALNLAGMGAIAWLAWDLAMVLQCSILVPIAIVLWPGFIVALTHDTAEIISTTLLLSAISALVRGRLLLYAALAACAILARETTLAIVAGVALAAVPWRGPRRASSGRRLLICLAPFAPFLIWRHIVAVALHSSPQAQGMAQDIGWPFLGAARMLLACVTGAHTWASTPGKDFAERAVVLLTAVPLIAVCSAAAVRLGPALRSASLAGVAVGWIFTAALMSTLTASGPWIDPNAYLRAFTECFVVGMLMLGAAGVPVRSTWIAIAALGEMLLGWGFCVAEMR